MKRSFIILLAFAIVVTATLALAISTTSAGDSGDLFEANFRLVYQDQDGYWNSSWKARSTPSVQVYRGSYFPHIPGSGITQTIQSEWTSANFNADPSSIWTPDGFWFTRGITRSTFLQARWSLDCRPGPELGIIKDNGIVSVLITNTTPITLYLKLGSAQAGEIPPASSLRLNPMNIGYVEAYQNPSRQGGYCSMLGWEFSTNQTPTATPTPVFLETNDVQISNISDSSLAISYITSQPVTSSVDYWRMNEVPQNAPDRLPSGYTHLAQVWGLKPATEYKFRINLNSTPIYTGTIQTLPSSVPPTPRNLLVCTTNNGQPANDVIIRVSRDDVYSPLAASWTSYGGCSMVDISSLNRNLQSSGVNTMGGGGEYLRVWALGGPLGEAYTEVPSDITSPVNLTIRPTVKAFWNLGPGWNVIALPISTTLRVSDLVSLSRGGVKEFYSYNAGQWNGTFISGTVLLGYDQQLQLGQGYFVLMDHPVRIPINGWAVENPIPLTLQASWNLIGIPNPVGLNAEDAMEKIGKTSSGAYKIPEGARYVYGGYEGHFAGYPINNWPIDPKEGIWLRAIEPMRFRPGLIGN